MGLTIFEKMYAMRYRKHAEHDWVFYRDLSENSIRICIAINYDNGHVIGFVQSLNVVYTKDDINNITNAYEEMQKDLLSLEKGGLIIVGKNDF